MDTFSQLRNFQNEESIIHSYKLRLRNIEHTIVNIYSNLDDEEIKTKVIMNLAEIKVSLESEGGLNLSLIFNKISIIYGVLKNEIDTSNNKTYVEQNQEFLNLLDDIGKILKQSGINIEPLREIYKETVEETVKKTIKEVIYSK